MIWRHNCRRRLLHVDAPISVTGLAEKLGVWWATAQHRIARLEESGVIVGYTAKVRPEPAPGASGAGCASSETSIPLSTRKARRPAYLACGFSW
ncbi:Lrp/AsnC family transcriptional regulator [Chromobacterium vaccinii]|nr:Lrp/AsnC family transcriptional regulator [Chromobacterium vaccinii]